MGDWTGTVPSFAAGAKLRGVDMQTMADISTGLTSAWTTWVPTLVNITTGGGSVTASYRRVGKMVDFRFVFIFGAGSAVGSSPTFTLPATPNAAYVSATFAAVPVGKLWILDSGTGIWEGTAVVLATNVASLVYSNEAGGAASNTITATAPMTWAANDRLVAWGSFETA